MSSQPLRPRVERVGKACQNCRDRKVRCKSPSSPLGFPLHSVSTDSHWKGTGVEPCKDCVRLRKECFYPPLQPRKRKVREIRVNRAPQARGSALQGRVTDAIYPRMSEVENGADSGSLTLSPQNDHPSLSAQSDVQQEAGGAQPAPATRHEPDELQSRNRLMDRLSRHRESGAFISNLSPAPPSHQAIDLGPRIPVNCGEERPTTHTWNNTDEDPNWDHEPWSWTSICSEAGSEWIWNVTEGRTFSATAKRSARDAVRGFPDDNSLAMSKNVMEMDETTVWKYVDCK